MSQSEIIYRSLIVKQRVAEKPSLGEFRLNTGRSPIIQLNDRRSSIIIEHLTAWCESESHGFLAYWFITFSDRQTLRIENLVASLIRQLCAAAKLLPGSLRNLWLKHDAAGSRPSTALLIETLDSIVSDFDNVGQDAFVVIDALDEVPNVKFQEYDSASAQDGPPPERRVLLDLIIGLDKRHSNLHFLITSREEGDIRESFRRSSAVNVEDSIAGDLELYVDNAIQEMIKDAPWKGKRTAQMKARIIRQNEKYVARFLVSLMMPELSALLGGERQHRMSCSL